MQWWKLKYNLDLGRIQIKEESEQDKWNKIYQMAINNWGFDNLKFYRAFYIYNSQKIADSLIDENYIVRLFAILDKRVGKRILIKLSHVITEQPEWLQFFYILRMKSENISY